MNLAAYCRVSTDKSDQLNSLEAQKKFFSEYTLKNGHKLVRIYADEGISGTKIKNRKEFLRLMKDADQGLFEMVVVKDISRFARNTVDFLKSIRALKARNIETVFLTSNQTVLGNSEFVLTIFGALAQEESANTSKRVKFGKKINAEKGRVPNIVYGYDKTAGDYFNMLINIEEAKVIHQIFDWYTDYGYGANKISQMLNEKGIKTKRNCSWSQNAITRLLTNELYIGRIINGKQEVGDFLTGERKDKDESEWLVIERPDLRIIEPKQFGAVQEILASRNRAFKIDRERQSNCHLFSTLIKCKECGYSFRRLTRTYHNTYITWVCSGRNLNGTQTCNNKTSINETKLMEELRDYFTALIKNKNNLVENVVSKFSRIYKAKEDPIGCEKDLQNKIAKLQKSRQKYMEMYTDELISRKELNEKVGSINKELERLHEDLQLIQYHLSKNDQLETVVQRTFKDIEDIISIVDMTNAQLKRIIKKIEVDREGNIDIYLRLFSDIGLDETVLVTDDRT